VGSRTAKGSKSQFQEEAGYFSESLAGRGIGW
jgi:hypothetical protein